MGIRLPQLRERRNATSQWPFLTTLDLSTIRNVRELKAMTKDHTGSSNPRTDQDVDGWVLGYKKGTRGSALPERSPGTPNVR